MTVSELTERILRKLGDTPGAAVSYYTASEVLAALNQLQRMFVFFTLCLETTASFSANGSTFYRMLQTYADWIVPLRVRISGGAKLRPTRLAELAALDSEWTARAGTPTRYTHSGCDLFGLYKQTNGTLSITYARSPVDLTASSSLEIPEEYQPEIIQGAPALVRVKEGQQEWDKTLEGWDRFMGAIKECAAAVRERNIEQGYDAMPPELKRYDKSALKRLAALQQAS